MDIINGDKPIIRKQNGVFYAYGTPWGGKEGLQKNCGVPLDCITFIDRAQMDSVRYVSEKDYLDRIISQVVFPPQMATMDQSARLLADFMRATPAALAMCTMQPTAPACVYDFWNEK